MHCYCMWMVSLDIYGYICSAWEMNAQSVEYKAKDVH